jgi:Flp pilus assembly protein TadG
MKTFSAGMPRLRVALCSTNSKRRQGSPAMRIRDPIRVASAFGAASQGNVGVIFALALIPLMFLIGAAVDYSRAGTVNTAMQAAVDATAIAMAKDIANVSSHLQQSAATWFSGSFNSPQAQNVNVTASQDPASSSVTVSATATVSTNFVGMMGIKSINVGVSSTATSGLKLQVALVLDNTGSMGGYGKMQSLIAASHSLLNQLQSAATNPGDVQVAIIPFTTDVNVGTSNSTANWLKWSYSALTGFGTGTVTVAPSTWSGCVTDRDQSYDVSNTAATSLATQFPANNPLFGCPPQIMPLSSNWTAHHNLVNQMTPLGETNLTIGLAWGWQALTTGSPLNAPAPSQGTNQIIIFMTDGFNTANRWTNVLFGSGTTGSIDARTQLVCTNIKAAGITVYTVQVDTAGQSPPSILLQQCASDIGKWFYLTNPGELVTTFSQIANKLSNLRIAR